MKRTVELSLEKAREWYQKGGELREITLQAYKEEELKSLTYEDICKELFKNQYFYISGAGKIFLGDIQSYILNSNNATSNRQLEKLLAINKLVNVAKYLNNGWEPNWINCNNTNYPLYGICYNTVLNKLSVFKYTFVSDSKVYFKTSELAQKAIEILGEDTIKLAIAENW